MAVDTKEELLAFERACRTFIDPRKQSVRAVEDLTFSLREGEFVCIVGPSGCGKSTLLRLAAGLDFPTEGTVHYRGAVMSGPARERGVVFQSYNAFPWLTVRENIGFGLAGENEASRRSKVERWLALTGLEEFAQSYPKALSGGMRQRLALARTLVVEPKMLLLDEPFGALDEPVRRSMQALLLGIVVNLGCSVLFVTHDIGEAIFLGDRVMLMSSRPGRILGVFPVPAPKSRGAEFFATPEFTALYEHILSRFPNTLVDV